MEHDFCQRDPCIYKEVHSVQVTSTSSTVVDDFTVTIYTEVIQHTEQLRITITNVNDERQSFTCILNRENYKDLQNDQDLCISFDRFPIKLRELFINSLKEILIMRLKVTTCTQIELGFFRMSDMKELTLLQITFERTAANELVQFFKNKADCYYEAYKTLGGKVTMLEQTQSNMVAEHRRQMEQIRNEHSLEIMQKNAALENKQIHFNDDFKNLATEFEKLKSENNILVKELDSSKIDQFNKNRIIVEQRKDMIDLQKALQYHRAKYEDNKKILVDIITSTVPMAKYDMLKGFFSNALGDLVKHQIYLKQVLSMNELQKTENKTLTDEINDCISTIKGMQEHFNITAENETALQEISSENAAVSEKIEELENKIEELGLQSNEK